MANKARQSLQKRVQKAIFQAAFFRLESALVISLTLLLTVFGSNLVEFIPFWAWLIGGAVAEGILVFSSLSDPIFGRKVVANLLQDEFHPEHLRDKRLQQQMNEALDYRSRIEEAIRRQRNTLLKDELSQTAGQIDEWLEHIYGLAQRIDNYQQEQKILARDRNRAESRMAQLQKELAHEDDAILRKQIEETLHSMQRQLDTLQTLENTIQRAELQLENSLTNLGTVYSQTMLVGAKDIDSSSARRLRQEISDEVDELQDVLLAMDEVYSAESAA